MTKQEYSDASRDGTVTVLMINQSKIPDGWYYRILIIIKTTFDCFQLLGPCEKHPVTYESLQFTCENVQFTWHFIFTCKTCSSHVKIAKCMPKCRIHVKKQIECDFMWHDLFPHVEIRIRMWQKKKTLHECMQFTCENVHFMWTFSFTCEKKPITCGNVHFTWPHFLFTW